MAQGIKDKVVVITGASSGLGEAAARRLAQHGAKLVLGARRLERLQALAEELSLGPDAAVQTDVTQYEQVKRLVDRAVQSQGRIDAIINNAGLMPHSPLERGKVQDWDRMIDVNLKGVLYGIAAALPYMKTQKGGHIINVSSVAGHKVRPGSAVYAATKTAVRVVSEGLRQEVKPYNIRTTVISPGAVATELPDSVTEPDVAENVRKFYEIALPADAFANIGGLCHEPAGRRGRQRDFVQAGPAGALSRPQNLGSRQGPVTFWVWRTGPLAAGGGFLFSSRPLKTHAVAVALATPARSGLGRVIMVTRRLARSGGLGSRLAGLEHLGSLAA